MRHFVIGSVAIFLGLAISSSGGVGGGGIAVPILILGMQISPQEAIPLANAAVLGSTTCGILYGLRKMHPQYSNRSAIDWDIIAILEPLTMVGTMLGTALHEYIPAIYSMACLDILLSAISIRMILRGVRENSDKTDLSKNVNTSGMNEAVRNESRKSPDSKKRAEQWSLVQESRQNNYGAGLVFHQHNNNNNKMNTNNRYNSNAVTDFEKQPSNAISLSNQLGLLEDGIEPVKSNHGTNFYFVALPQEDDDINGDNEDSVNENVDVSSSSSSSKIKVPLYMISLSVGTAIINTIVIFNINHRVLSLILRCGLALFVLSLGYLMRTNIIESFPRFATSDVNFYDTKNLYLFPFFCSCAGVIAGLFGIGGGVFKSPLMIEMGLHPKVAATTSTAMMFFTTLTAATSYAINSGALYWHYALPYFLMGIIAFIVGNLMNDQLHRFLKTNSFISITIGVVIGISAVLMTAETISLL